VGSESHRSPDIPDIAWLQEMRRYTAETVQDCIETDLSVIDTLIHLSEDAYQRGKRQESDRAKAEAQRGIEHIRNFISTSDLVSSELKKSFAHRCDELTVRINAAHPK
jgi:hypothetical protein